MQLQETTRSAEVGRILTTFHSAMLQRLWLGAICLVIASVSPCFAADDSQGMRAEIDQIKKQLQEMDQLKARVADLEKKLEDAQSQNAELKKAQESNAPSVTTLLKDAKIKVDGRFFAGVFDSAKDGDYPRTSTDLSDAKIRFIFNPSKRVSIVNRFRTANGKVDAFDLFYLDYMNAFGLNNTLRVGQRKIDFGQETWADNPVDNMLISPSAAHAGGYGVGLAFVGRFTGQPTSPLYEIGTINGGRGDTVRTSPGQAWNAKIGAAFAERAFASFSYTDTGRMGPADKAALLIADIGDAPAGATSWNRKAWEANLRWNYGPTGVRPMMPSEDLPPYMVGASYGRFDDNIAGTASRKGDFWLMEGLYSIPNSRFFAASRYSRVSLDDGALAKLNKLTTPVNSYNRLTVGIGYKLSSWTQIKGEYSFNSTGGSISDPDLNRWAIGFASRF